MVLRREGKSPSTEMDTPEYIYYSCLSESCRTHPLLWAHGVCPGLELQALWLILTEVELALVVGVVVPGGPESAIMAESG